MIFELLIISVYCCLNVYQEPNNIMLGIMNGHNSMASGTYKHSLGKYTTWITCIIPLHSIIGAINKESHAMFSSLLIMLHPVHEDSIIEEVCTFGSYIMQC